MQKPNHECHEVVQIVSFGNIMAEEKEEWEIGYSKDHPPVNEEKAKTADIPIVDEMVGQMLDGRFLIEQDLTEGGAEEGGIGLVYLAQDMKLTIAVDKNSGGKQVPWTSSSLRGEFYFNNDGKAIAVARPIVNPTSLKPINHTASAAEQASWDSVKNSTDVSDLELYLKEFPNGLYASAARFQIKKLDKDAWAVVKDSEDAAKIQGYLDKFPGSENAPVARIILKKLNDGEREEWEAVKDSDDPAKIQGYLNKYPRGKNSQIARTSLKRLSDKQKAEEKLLKPGWVKRTRTGTEYLEVMDRRRRSARLEMKEEGLWFIYPTVKKQNVVYPCSELKDVVDRDSGAYSGIRFIFRNGKKNTFWFRKKNEKIISRKKTEYVKQYCGL